MRICIFYCYSIKKGLDFPALFGAPCIDYKRRLCKGVLDVSHGPVMCIRLLFEKLILLQVQKKVLVWRLDDNDDLPNLLQQRFL